MKCYFAPLFAVGVICGMDGVPENAVRTKIVSYREVCLAQKDNDGTVRRDAPPFWVGFAQRDILFRNAEEPINTETDKNKGVYTCCAGIGAGCCGGMYFSGLIIKFCGVAPKYLTVMGFATGMCTLMTALGCYVCCNACHDRREEQEEVSSRRVPALIGVVIQPPAEQGLQDVKTISESPAIQRMTKRRGSFRR